MSEAQYQPDEILHEASSISVSGVEASVQGPENKLRPTFNSVESARQAIDAQVHLYTKIFSTDVSPSQRTDIWNALTDQGIVNNDAADSWRFAQGANLADVWLIMDQTLGQEMAARQEIQDAMTSMMANSPTHTRFEVTTDDLDPSFQDVKFHVSDARGNGLGLYGTDELENDPTYTHTTTQSSWDGHFDLSEAVASLKEDYRAIPDNLVVYTQDNCMQCRMTQRALDKAGIPYLVSDIQDDPEALDHFKALGIQTAPIVEQVGREPYGGLRPDKIKEIMNNLGPVNKPSTAVPPSLNSSAVRGATEQKKGPTRS